VGTSVSVEGCIRLKLEAVYPSEVSVRFYKTTRIDMKGDCDVITVSVVKHLTYNLICGP